MNIKYDLKERTAKFGEKIIKLCKTNIDNILLRILYDNELMGYLVSSYLFNKHDIRILPTISVDDPVLRNIVFLI